MASHQVFYPGDLPVIYPPDGRLFRAGRWADLQVYPPPAQPLGIEVEPLLDGYRWEDAYGRFATVKCSVSAEAAIGRTIANFRRREVGGIGMFDKIKAFLTNDPDPNEPRTVVNQVPPAYFDDAHLLELNDLHEVPFVDLGAPLAVEIIRWLTSGVMQLLRVVIPDDLANERDRRITRLVMSSLYEFLRGTDLAGIRYAARDSHWDAFVLWDHPQPIDLIDGDLRPIFPDDPDLGDASVELGLDPP